MVLQLSDHFHILDTFTLKGEQVSFYRLGLLESLFGITLKRLPYALRILLEAAVRRCDGQNITATEVEQIARWSPVAQNTAIPFMPARIIMQDHSGIPCLLDLAALREALHRAGGSPEGINPLLAVDLIIDHSVQVDFSASPSAFRHNAELEFHRNRERYEFLRWATGAFHNLRVVPPNTGIIHQINLEYLARVVMQQRFQDTLLLYPDTLVGTDSHTTMINALGIVGWGVGGIEAEALMMGQHISLPAPQVIGVEIVGRLQEGVTSTDLALALTQRLRQKGVVEKFVEFYGTGLKQLSLPDRATIANMAPEYGATMGYFPIDAETLRYLQDTGRAETALLAERYYQEQDLLYTDSAEVPHYTETIQFDLSAVVPALAGPKRPQDRINLADVQERFTAALTAPTGQQGYGLAPDTLSSADRQQEASSLKLEHGSVVLAAITSCTNTSNPSVMIGAGLLAKNALQRGLRVKPHVKTSMAPGSQVVGRYLAAAGLLEPLNTLGFHIVGYGCTVCIGNSGALHEDVAQALTENPLVVAAVLSGNRNFEGRIHPQVKANFLASPPLVIAYALAGTIKINLLTDPLGYDQHDQPIYLRDIWPTQQEISATITRVIKPEMFLQAYEDIWEGGEMWNNLSTTQSDLYRWNPASTYIQEPPFFQDVPLQLPDASEITNARVLIYGGDSVTTDHISPAGNIASESPAGEYLRAHGVARQDFNQYGTRRGNDQVMLRGTFANVRLKNLLTPDVEGGYTLHLPTQECLTVFDAAERYKQEHIPLIILAGRDYGMGSSRDWAAKGTKLLGVSAVIAESYERIHRSNLIGMGVLPLQFKEGQNARTLALSGHETFTITGLSSLQPGTELSVLATREVGTAMRFSVIAQLHTPLEIDYYRQGGIFPKLLRQQLAENEKE